MVMCVVQIQDKVQELLEERDKLHGTWLSKRDRLNQVYDQQAFLRDAQQLELLSTSQEVCLQSILNVLLSSYF